MFLMSDEFIDESVELKLTIKYMCSRLNCILAKSRFSNPREPVLRPPASKKGRKRNENWKNKNKKQNIKTRTIIKN